MNHPEHDKLIAIAKGWQMERGSAEKWEPCTSGAALRLIGNNLGKFIRIAPDRPEVAELPPLTCSQSKRTNCALYDSGAGRRPSPEWYAAKIQETIDDDFTIGPATPNHAAAAAAGKESGNEQVRDLLYATVKMQVREAERVDRVVAGLEEVRAAAEIGKSKGGA